MTAKSGELVEELVEQLKEAVQYEVGAGEGSWTPLKKEREE